MSVAPKAGEVRVAVVQEAPVLLDLDAGLAAATKHLQTAAGEGARLVVFPETYLPGYPEWIWRLRPDAEVNDDLHRMLLEQAVDLEADALKPLRDKAAELGVVVVLGVHERDGRFSRATLYSTLVVIGPDGRILNRHRKLVPTSPERMVWGPGDGQGLVAVDTPVGRVGGLVCWENYMPLARYALYADGVEVYVAPTWDFGDTWLATLQHIAAEGRCWVVGAGFALHTDDIPESLPHRAELYAEDEWLNDGDSVVVAPGGDIVAGPLRAEHGILYADIDPGRAPAGHRMLDVAGHYSRPDVFTLTVDRSRRRPVHGG